MRYPGSVQNHRLTQRIGRLTQRIGRLCRRIESGRRLRTALAG